MKWLAILVSLPLSLSACSDPEPTPEQTRAAEDRAIAAVEAAQDVPPNPVTLEPITFRDIDEHGLSGAGCALPVMARARYDGREYGLTLDLAEGEGRRTGTETTDYPGRLELRNGRDQVVFGASGVMQCGT